MKKLVNLKNFIYLSLVATPLYMVRFSVFGIPENVFELMTIVSIALFFIETRSSRIELGEYRRYFVPIGLIIGGLIISTITNGSYAVGFGIIKSWFIVPMVFAFISAALLKSENSLKTIYISAFLVACASLVYLFLGKLTYDGRLQGFYNSPNYLAMFLTPPIIIGLSMFSENKKYYIVSLASMAVALYFTFSYAAWIAVAIALIMTLFLRKKKWLTQGKMLVAMLVILIAVFLQGGTTKMNSLLHKEGRSSLASRIMIWSAAGKIITDNPVIGIGPGNFQNKYLEYQKYFPPYLEWAVPEPHNLVLAFWLQAGMLGLAGFVSLLFLWFRDLRNKKERNILIICASAMVCIIAQGLFDTTYFKNDLAVVFWLIFFAAIKNHSEISAE